MASARPSGAGAGAGPGRPAPYLTQGKEDKENAAGGITQGQLVKAATNERKPGEPVAKYLARITHVNLNNKGLTSLSNLNLCANLKVIYLYDNKLTSMEGLQAPLCTHLYLQNNQITEIANLDKMPKLTKLFLDHNAIARVEGLTGCPLLEELYVSNQRLSKDVELTFDYDSLEAIGRSLRILTTAGNKMTSAVPLALLNGLETCDLSNNMIAEAKELEPFLQYTPYLRKLDIRRNPFCKKAKYRDAIILASQSLAELDKKNIEPKQRQYLQRLAERKSKKGAAGRGGAAAGRGAGAGRGGEKPKQVYKQPSALGSQPGARRVGAGGFSAATADSGRASKAVAARKARGGAGSQMSGAGDIGLGVAGVRASSAASQRK